MNFSRKLKNNAEIKRKKTWKKKFGKKTRLNMQENLV